MDIDPGTLGLQECVSTIINVVRERWVILE